MISLSRSSVNSDLRRYKMSNENRLLLIDAFNLVRRIYEARPDSGEYIQDVVDAAVRSAQRALREHRPSHACIAFDSHDRTWRHLLYAEYKANRKPTPAPLMAAVPTLMAAFEEIGVASLKVDNYEADDQIATMARVVADAGGEAIVLSTDRMFQQLLGPGIRVINHFDGHEFGPVEVRDRYGVDVAQLTDFWAMAGDTSNNIKGVPRVGAKTAAQLLVEYGTLEDILRTEDGNTSVERVRAAGDVVQRCKQLVTLKTDVVLGTNLRKFRL